MWTSENWLPVDRDPGEKCQNLVTENLPLWPPERMTGGLERLTRRIDAASRRARQAQLPAMTQTSASHHDAQPCGCTPADGRPNWAAARKNGTPTPARPSPEGRGVVRQHARLPCGPRGSSPGWRGEVTPVPCRSVQRSGFDTATLPAGTTRCLNSQGIRASARHGPRAARRQDEVLLVYWYAQRHDVVIPRFPPGEVTRSSAAARAVPRVGPGEDHRAGVGPARVELPHGVRNPRVIRRSPAARTPARSPGRGGRTRWR